MLIYKTVIYHTRLIWQLTVFGIMLLKDISILVVALDYFFVEYCDQLEKILSIASIFMIFLCLNCRFFNNSLSLFVPFFFSIKTNSLDKLS